MAEPDANANCYPEDLLLTGLLEDREILAGFSEVPAAPPTLPAYLAQILAVHKTALTLPDL